MAITLSNLVFLAIIFSSAVRAQRIDRDTVYWDVYIVDCIFLSTLCNELMQQTSLATHLTANILPLRDLHGLLSALNSGVVRGGKEQSVRRSVLPGGQLLGKATAGVAFHVEWLRYISIELLLRLIAHIISLIALHVDIFEGQG